MPKEFWIEAIDYAVYLLNRSKMYKIKQNNKFRMEES